MLWWTLRQLKSPDPDIRIKTVRSLGADKNRKAVPALVELLQDENADVRLAAINALETIGHPASADPLVSALSRSIKNTDTGLAAEHEAIGRALASVGTAAVQPLIQALESGEKETRRRAAITLGVIKDAAAIESLAGKLEDSRSEVRKAAAISLGQIGEARAVGALAKATANRDYETRLAAAEALGLLQSEQGVEALVKAASDSNEAVQVAAIKGLGRIGGLQAASCLRSAMASARKAVADAAASALNSIVLSPENAEQRAEAAVLRGDFDAAVREGQVAVPALIVAMGFKDTQMRAQAARALGSLMAEAAVPSLLAALKDHTAVVQVSAAQALVSIGENSRSGLEEMLSHYDASTVKLAAISLGEIGSADSVPALAQLISENASVPAEYPDLFDAVSAAADSLLRIFNSSSAGILRPMLDQLVRLPAQVCLVGPAPKSIELTAIRNKAAYEIESRT